MCYKTKRMRIKLDAAVGSSQIRSKMTCGGSDHSGSQLPVCAPQPDVLLAPANLFQVETFVSLVLRG